MGNFRGPAHDNFEIRIALKKGDTVMEHSRDALAELLPNIANQMRGLLSSLYLAASQAIPASQREQDPILDAKAAVLEQSFYRLLRLVNSLSAAEYMIEDQPLPLRDGDLVHLTSEICETAGSVAELLGIRLSFICAMERRICSLHLSAMEQLLYQLLSNALKFTPKGGSVTVELKKTGENLLLSVTDTGPGIPSERMDDLFGGPLNTPPSPPPHGLGLGLPLCRAIAEKHGGCLLVRSTPGKGSCFTVSLPDRRTGGQIADIPSTYNGGFNRTLLGLADALPASVYTIRNLD